MDFVRVNNNYTETGVESVRDYENSNYRVRIMDSYVGGEYDSKVVNVWEIDNDEYDFKSYNYPKKMKDAEILEDLA